MGGIVVDEKRRPVDVSDEAIKKWLAKRSKTRLMLGLQETSGKVAFDLSTPLCCRRR